MHLPVGAQQFVCHAVAFVDAGGAKAVVELRRLRKRTHAIGVREARGLAEPDQFRNRRQFPFNEHAGRIAVCILDDLDRLDRRNGIARDAGAFERRAVGARNKRLRAAPEAPDRADVDRIVRRGAVELPARRPAPLGEDLRYVQIERRIADRHGHDPLAGHPAACDFSDALLDVADRAHAPERGKHRAQRLAVHMGVAVDQAGRHGPAVQIDDARGGRGIFRHGGIRPDRDDPLAYYRHRLRDARARVDGDDVAVLENAIGRPSRHACRRRAGRRVAS
jgi:hypothetical protein